MIDLYALHGGAEPVDQNGCAHIRLLRPLSHPLLAGAVRLTHGVVSPDGNPDLVIIDRFVKWSPIDRRERLGALVAALRLRRIPFVYSLDDNILDLHLDAPWHPFPGDDLRNLVRFLARRADGLIVSTPALRDRVSFLNQRIAVVPNALDERLFTEKSAPPESRKQQDRITVGYMGTGTHDRDLMMVLSPLREVLSRYKGRVALELVGVSEDPRIPMLFSGLPVTMKSPGPDNFYPRFPAWMQANLGWDLAIAPLEDNAFTRCKSDMKFLDYGILGVPAVFSDVPAYADSVRHRETGLLAANEPRIWREALIELIENAPLRTAIGAAAFEHVRSRRMLAQMAPQWLAALENFVGV